VEAHLDDVRDELLSLRAIKATSTQFELPQPREVAREIPTTSKAVQVTSSRDCGATLPAPTDPETTTRLLLVEAEIRGLKALVDELRQSRDAWQTQSERTTLALTGLQPGLKAMVDELRQARDAWQTQADRTMAELNGLHPGRCPWTVNRAEPDRRSWWRRMSA
jgi:hypothetical protein